MKKRVLSILLALCMLAGLLPVLPAFAAEGDIPGTLYIEETAAAGIPTRIDVYPDPAGTANLYHLYLPGNAVTGSCFLSWEGGLSASAGGQTYASGALPVPAPGETKTVTFTKGSTTKTFNIRTYKGSESVHPIFFELDESQGTIAAMLENKNNTCTGSVIIDGKRLALEQIKGRGNATWRDDKEKKPFNFKIAKSEKKLELNWLDCEKTRKWTLLSNVNDRSLLRNKVAYDLAHQMGIGFDSAAVDIWLNGVYWGTYQLTPKTDAYVSDDGFLLEDNNIVDDEDPSFNTGGMIINIKEIGDNLIIAEGGDPDNPSSQATQAVKSKIQSYFGDVWNAMSASNGKNSKGVYYTDYFDMDSMASFYLLHEFIKNLEVDGGSIFLTRNGMADTDKLIAGPAWDYDNSMGYNGSNGSMAAGGSGWPRSPLNYASLSVGNWYITGRNRGKLFGTLSKHQDFLDKTHEVYNQYYTFFDDVKENVRRQAALIEDSAEMNFVRTVKEDKNNFDFPNHNTQFDEGTPYEVNYKEAQVWSEYVDNLVTYTTGRARYFHDQMYVENTCDHDYQVVVTQPTCTEGGGTTYTCTKCGDTYTENETPPLGHDFVDGVCSRCGAYAMKVFFMCDEGVTIDVAKTQAADSEVYENVTVAYPRNSETGEIDISGDGQVNFVVKVADGYRLDTVSANPGSNYKNLKLPDETLVDNGYRITKIAGNVTVTVTAYEVGPCEHDYKAEVTAPTCTAQGFTTYTCSKCGDSYVSDYKAKVPHNYVGGTCTVCGEKLVNVTFSCSEGASVTVYETQKTDSPKVENAAAANPRDGDTGLIDCSGEGQVNFTVNLAEGYSLESVTAAPAGNYKNLKGPADTGIENGYRATKVSGDFTITVTAKKGETVPCVHEFVDGVCVKCGEVAMKATFVCDEGVSINVAKTQAADSEILENVTVAYPRDSATGDIDISGSGQINFVVTLADGYRLESITAEPAANYNNFKLPAETLVNNGYRITKMTGDVTVTVRASKAGPGDCEHDYKAVVTAPSCTAQGFTTYTCSKCGDSYVADYTAKTAHNYRNGVCAVCGEKLVNVTISCSEGASVTVYETQKTDSPKVENAAAANPRDGDSGLIDCSGEGQVNFTVTLAEGYELESVTAEPAGSYKNLKGPADTGIANGYRITKVKDDFTIMVQAKKTGEVPPKADKTELGKAINDAAHYKEEDYTPESYLVLKQALEHARAVMEDPDAEQVDVDAAVRDVTEAIKGLEKKPEALDKDALIELIGQAGDLNPIRYMEESRKALAEGIAAAEKALEEARTQEEIDAAAEALAQVIDSLEGYLFDDVQDADKFYFDPVYWAFFAEPQITNGISPIYFDPEGICTRGHVVTFLWRVAGRPEPKSAETPFRDLKKGAFYEKAVAWAVENGITNGISSDRFNPQGVCTRGQIVTFLWRFKGMPDPKTTETPFKDLKDGAFYLDAVAWALENEVTNGLSADQFGPESFCTRGQIVTFLYRAASLE